MSDSRQGLEVLPGLTLPETELQIRRTRSSGPGGQNVNKVSTRVEVFFDVVQSAVLDAAQRQRILQRLATRISKEGVLRVTAQAERTQARNEERARRRLAELLAEALRLPRRRRATRPTRASVQKRVASKKQRAGIKQKRQRPTSED